MMASTLADNVSTQTAPLSVEPMPVVYEQFKVSDVTPMTTGQYDHLGVGSPSRTCTAAGYCRSCITPMTKPPPPARRSQRPSPRLSWSSHDGRCRVRLPVRNGEPPDKRR